MAFCCLLLAFTVTRANADDNLVQNGDLSRGAGESPAVWQADAWLNGPQYTTYAWHHSRNAPGELEVSSAQPNDARWIEKIHLAPGWYHFTASVRAEGVGTDSYGANLSVLEDGIMSPDLRGTRGWQTLGFYLKAGPDGADIVLACRLGEYASLNTGKAFFRDVRAVKIDQPPAGATPLYDLDAIRNVGKPQPSPSISTSGNTAEVALLLIAALGVLIALFLSRGPGREMLERIRRSAEPRATRPSAIEPRETPRREIEIALFLVSILTFAYFYQASDHGIACRIDLIRSILERHTLWIDGYAGYNTADLTNWGGHVYSIKAPGASLTGIIPWIFATTLFRLFLSEGPLYWAFVTYLATVLSVSLIVALTVVLVYRCALLLGAGQTRAVALALTLAFATIMFPFATEFTGEPIAAACEFAAFYLLALPDEDERLTRSLAAGLLAGWGVLCDFPSLLLAAAVAGYALWKLWDWRRLMPFAGGAAAIAALLLIHNALAFGNPFFLSYESLMLPTNTSFPEQMVGFAGATPRLKLSVVWQVLFDPQRGLFFCNPVLILAFVGLFALRRETRLRAEFALIAGVIAIFILFNGSLVDSIRVWGGGTGTGPRHMVAVLPFMVLAIAFIPEQLNWVFGALAFISAFLMLMATAVEPHLPYEYTNPVRDFIWPAYLRGDLAYNKLPFFGGGPIAGDSVAFNLGKLAGLPGSLQMWPLAALWIGGAIYLMRETGSLARVANRSLAQAAAALAIAALFAPPTLGLLTAPSLDQAHGLLGCYYEGMRPDGARPHIRRIDSTIDFDTLAQLGALPYPSCVVWRGQIIAPSAGLYRFVIDVDDSGWLKIDGRPVIADPGEVTRMHDAGSVELTAGPHTIEVGQRNLWGDAQMHLRWQPPGAALQVVPSEYLVPDRSACAL